MGKIWIIEHHTSRGTKNDAEYGDHIGMNVKVIEEARPQQTEWPRKVYVKPFLGILRLKSGLQGIVFDLFGHVTNDE